MLEYWTLGYWVLEPGRAGGYVPARSESGPQTLRISLANGALVACRAATLRCQPYNPQGLEKRGVMSKRYEHLWPQVASLGNLLVAYYEAARGKRRKPNVVTFEYDLEENLLQLCENLSSSACCCQWLPGKYQIARPPATRAVLEGRATRRLV